MSKAARIAKWTGKVLGLLLLAALVVFGALQAREWADTLKVSGIEVVGNGLADSSGVASLLRVDTTMRLFDMDPVLLADRARRHPWVERADVARLPSGRLRVTVEERTPVALALNASGRPLFYLSADGVAMPPVRGRAFDVPVLLNVAPALQVGKETQDFALREVLTALSGLDPYGDAIISTVERRGKEWWLRTTATTAHPSLEVRLGAGGVAEKLRRLQAFWQQAVITRPQVQYAAIDLRFINQIVTKESVSDR